MTALMYAAADDHVDAVQVPHPDEHAEATPQLINIKTFKTRP